MSKKKETQKKEFTKKIIPLIIGAVVLYTVASFILQFTTQVEISPTLTSCFFAFFGCEVLSLMGIKVSKIKHEYGQNTMPDIGVEDTEDETDDEVCG